MAAPLASVSPLFATYFAAVSIARWIQQKHPDEEMTFIQNANAGLLAGVLTTVNYKF